MVFFHKTLAFLWKSTKVNNLVIRVGSKFFSTEVQVFQHRFTEKKPKPTYRIDGVACFMLLMPVTAFGLGIWQAMRKVEKTEMIRYLQEKSNAPPVDLPKDLNQLKNMEFQPIRVKGKFDHSKELYIGPRPLYKEKFIDTSSLISVPKGGYLVITPFTLSDRNLTILINRGWIPKNKKSPKKREEGQVTEEVELVGLLRLTEKRPQFSMKNQPEKNFWIYKDLEEMAKVTEASPILLDVVKSSSVPGGPIGGQTNVTLKDDHVTYMVTWFGVSLVTGWMWYNRYLRKVSVASRINF